MQPSPRVHEPHTQSVVHAPKCGAKPIVGSRKIKQLEESSQGEDGGEGDDMWLLGNVSVRRRVIGGSALGWKMSSALVVWLVVAAAAHLRLVNAASTVSSVEINLVGQSEAAEMNSSTTNGVAETTADEGKWYDVVLLVLKASIMIMIIVASIFGNLLVIVSVMRVRKLR